MASDRGMPCLYVGLLVLLGGLLAAALGVEPWARAYLAVGSLGAGPFDPQRLDRSVARLGGPERAALLAMDYLRLPAEVASERPAALALASRAAPRAAAELAAALGDPRAAVRLAAAAALAGAPAEEACPALLGVRADPDEEVRRQAARSLAECGAAPGAPAREYLACLAAAGWQTESRAAAPGWEVLELGTGAEDRAPHRTVLVERPAGGPGAVAAEWFDRAGGRSFPEARFAELTGDRAPELLVREVCTAGQDAGVSRLRVFRLGVAVVEITPDLPGRWLAEEVRDLDGDGRGELLVRVAEYECYWWHPQGGSPACRRVYAWEGSAGRFEDRSRRFAAYYRLSIRRHRLAVARDPGGYFPSEWSASAVSALLDHWCLGQSDEGQRAFSRDMARLKRRLGREQRAAAEAMEDDLATRLGLPRG